jgi:hypothetical protein
MVEGPDDKWSIINLLKRHGFDWDDGSMARPYVHDVGGVDALLDKNLLSGALKSYERLGIIVDADLPPTNRWHQARNVLTALGLMLPPAPERDGTVIDGLRPNTRVGIWIMPDNLQPGRIEEFIEKLVPADHPTWTHARETTTQAQALGAPLRQQDHVKGALHAWLAWQADPGQPFGVALASRVLGHDSPEARSFVAWFKRCFT